MRRVLVMDILRGQLQESSRRHRVLSVVFTLPPPDHCPMTFGFFYGPRATEVASWLPAPSPKKKNDADSPAERSAPSSCMLSSCSRSVHRRHIATPPPSANLGTSSPVHAPIYATGFCTGAAFINQFGRSRAPASEIASECCLAMVRRVWCSLWGFVRFQPVGLGISGMSDAWADHDTPSPAARRTRSGANVANDLSVDRGTGTGGHETEGLSHTTGWSWWHWKYRISRKSPLSASTRVH